MKILCFKNIKMHNGFSSNYILVHPVLVLYTGSLSVWCVFFNIPGVRKWTLQTTCSCLWPWLHSQWGCGGLLTGHAVALAWELPLHFSQPSLHSYWYIMECFSEFLSFIFSITLKIFVSQNMTTFERCIINAFFSLYVHAGIHLLTSCTYDLGCPASFLLVW